MSSPGDSVGRLVLRFKGSPEGAKSLRARLEGIAKTSLGAKLSELITECAPSLRGMKIQRVHVAFPVDPREHDDETLGWLWASEILKAVSSENQRTQAVTTAESAWPTETATPPERARQAGSAWAAEPTSQAERTESVDRSLPFGKATPAAREQMAARLRNADLSPPRSTYPEPSISETRPSVAPASARHAVPPTISRTAMETVRRLMEVNRAADPASLGSEVHWTAALLSHLRNETWWLDGIAPLPAAAAAVHDLGGSSGPSASSGTDITHRVSRALAVATARIPAGDQERARKWRSAALRSFPGVDRSGVNPSERAGDDRTRLREEVGHLVELMIYALQLVPEISLVECLEAVEVLRAELGSKASQKPPVADPGSSCPENETRRGDHHSEDRGAPRSLEPREERPGRKGMSSGLRRHSRHGAVSPALDPDHLVMAAESVELQLPGEDAGVDRDSGRVANRSENLRTDGLGQAVARYLEVTGRERGLGDQPLRERAGGHLMAALRELVEHKGDWPPWLDRGLLEADWFLCDRPPNRSELTALLPVKVREAGAGAGARAIFQRYRSALASPDSHPAAEASGLRMPSRGEPSEPSGPPLAPLDFEVESAFLAELIVAGESDSGGQSRIAERAAAQLLERVLDHMERGGAWPKSLGAGRGAASLWFAERRPPTARELVGQFRDAGSPTPSERAVDQNPVATRAWDAALYQRPDGRIESRAAGVALFIPFLGRACEALFLALDAPSDEGKRRRYRLWLLALLCHLDAPVPWSDDPMVRLLAGYSIDGFEGDSVVSAPSPLESPLLRKVALDLIQSFGAVVPGLESHGHGMIQSYFVLRGGLISPEGSRGRVVQLFRRELDMLLDRSELPLGISSLPWVGLLEVQLTGSGEGGE